jgi:hypothetical protein
MKIKWRLWSWPTFAVVFVAWCVFAYIYMYPPVVWNYWSFHRRTSDSLRCLNNLRQIDAAVNQWALEHRKHNGDSVTLEDLTPYIKLNSHGEIPACPSGGKYSVTVVGVNPTCSLGANSSGVKIRLGYFYYEEDRSPHMLP